MRFARAYQTEKAEDKDACKWDKKEAKHYLIFLNEEDRIYSLTVRGQIRRSVIDDLNELGTYNDVIFQEWFTCFKQFYKNSNVLLKKSTKFDDEELGIPTTLKRRSFARISIASTRYGRHAREKETRDSVFVSCCWAADVYLPKKITKSLSGAATITHKTIKQYISTICDHYTRQVSMERYTA
jgi:hypothetical protein